MTDLRIEKRRHLIIDIGKQFARVETPEGPIDVKVATVGEHPILFIQESERHPGMEVNIRSLIVDLINAHLGTKK